MTNDVVTVEETDYLSNLLESMQALRFRHLPVTDGGRLIGLINAPNALVGIVTSSDFMAAVTKVAATT